MKRMVPIRSLLLLPVLASIMLVGAAGAEAKSGVTVTTTIVVTSETTLSTRTAGGNVILEIHQTGYKAGLWDWSAATTRIIHPNGTFTQSGHGTFAGTAGECGDVSGEWAYAARGTLNPDGTVSGGGKAHSINESTNPGGFRFSEEFGFDGVATFTYAC